MFWKQQGNKTENTSSLEGCAIPDGKFYKLFDAFKKLLLVAKRFFSKLTNFTVTESKTIYLVMRLCLRDRPRFFDQVGHQTTNASIGNKHFFTK